MLCLHLLANLFQRMLRTSFQRSGYSSALPYGAIKYYKAFTNTAGIRAVLNERQQLLMLYTSGRSSERTTTVRTFINRDISVLGYFTGSNES